ncbi:MAG: NAD-dependent epimerase/dehydratase family protein [Methanobacterium sp.]|jgi:nucleoside-diphosphate-sugar epimerase
MMNYESVKGKNVMVTGAAGVIGRELLNILISKDANVLSVDRLPLPEGDYGKVKHIMMDLAVDSYDELIEFKPEVIIHLAAAFERSGESPDFWGTNWHDNNLVSHRLVDFIKQLPSLEVFVFASSYLLYNPSLYLSNTQRDGVTYLREDDVIIPRNLCGASKFYTEREIEFVRKVVKPELRQVNARIYRVYGRGSKDVISRWIRNGLANENIETYNKDNQFDYIFAGDVAEGLLVLAENGNAMGNVNLGSGVARSVNDVLNILLDLNILDESLIIDKGVTEDFEASCADLTRLKSLTGWVPPTDLKTGIKKIIDYERGI